MAAPVTFAVLTNIVTFMPLYFIPGVMGKIFRAIPVVVGMVFFISLIEALFVLPAHLGHQRPLQGRIGVLLERMQARISNGITKIIKKSFTPLIIIALRYRYISTAIAMIILLLTGAYIKSGHMGMTMFPKVESDRAYVSFELPVGASAKKVEATLTTLLHSAKK